MPFNRNNINNNNSTLKSIDEQFTTTATSSNTHFEEEIEDGDGDDEFNDIDDIDDEDDEEDDYFENIIKEVISDQNIDSNNNESLSSLQHHQLSSNSKQYFEPQQTNATQVIKVSEDDLLDQRDILRSLFKTDLLDRYECRCDTNQGLFITKQTKLSKSLQRKLANLYQLLHQYQLPPPAQADNLLDQVNTNPAKISQILTNSVQNQEYKKKLFRSMRSIIERILIDALMICDQYHNQMQQQEQLMHSQTSSNTTTPPTTNSNNPTTKLWCEIRSRGCQFLGPQMQDDVLRLILHALETVTRMSRKVLVLYVVHMLKKHYPKASKTSVGHVVQLLYRAGCFKVEKRENDSSLMELKKEYSKYPALRRQHDTQIIQIALESGIRMSPEQWSQKLFGDSNHKSEMQSIIDKLQSQQTLEKLISDFYDKLATNNCAALSASSSPSSSFSANRSNSCSSSNSNFDLAVNSLFLQVKADFDYFAMINFEKKQPAQTLASSSSASSSQQQLKRSDIGSGGESLTSEDDESSSFADHHDLNPYDFDDDFDLKLFSSVSTNPKSQTQPQVEQTKIVWSLLVDCLKRAIKIVSSHVEYSSKMLTLIIANNTANRLNNTSSTCNTTNNTKPVVNRSNMHRVYDLDEMENSTNGFASSSGVGVPTNQMRTLVAMGPTAPVSKTFNNKRVNSNFQSKQQSSFNGSNNLLNNSKINNSNLFGSNNIYDFNNTSNKPQGFYQQSNNIFDLNMINKNFNKNYYDSKNKQQFYSPNHHNQHQQQSNDITYHQFTNFKHSTATNGRKNFDE